LPFGSAFVMAPILPSFFSKGNKYKGYGLSALKFLGSERGDYLRFAALNVLPEKSQNQKSRHAKNFIVSTPHT